MLKRFKYSVTRFHDEFDDDFDYEFYAESRLDALLEIVADLTDVYAETAKEAKIVAKQWLDSELGGTWTVDDVLNADLQLWKDDATFYRLNHLRETESPPV
jgi:hypothetical protein